MGIATQVQRQGLLLRYKHDKLEQYTRRESIRLVGISEEADETTEALQQKIVKVAADAGVEMSTSDISVCHRLGNKAPDQLQQGRSPKPRPIVCKFVSRASKIKLMAAKKNLKDKSEYKRVFINDNLTAMRAKMLAVVKESPNVESSFTKDGKIMCFLKDDKRARKRPVMVETPDDLFKIGLDSVDYVRLGLQDFVIKNTGEENVAG